MQFHSLLLAGPFLGLAAQAQVNTGPANLPINGQNGALHFPISCSVLGSTEVFDGVFTGTGPVVGGPGQELYLSDSTVHVTIPSSPLIDLAGVLGITQASAFVKGNFTGTNTANKIIPIFPDGLTVSNISIPLGKDIDVNIPQNGGTLPPIGPVKLGSTEGRAVVFFSNLLIELNLQNSAGHNVLSNIPITCGQPDPNIQLFVIAVHGEPGQAPLTIDGLGTFPDVPDNFEVGSFRFPYTCDLAGLGPQDVDLSLSGTVPTYLAPGANFSITDASAFLRLPTSIATDLVKKYPTFTSFKTVVSSFFVTTTAASPANVNALASPMSLNVGSSNGTLTVAVPESGYLPPVGPITADNTSGDTVFIGTGDAVAYLLLADKTGSQVANISVTCAPSIPVDFIGFPITNDKPPTPST